MGNLIFLVGAIGLSIVGSVLLWLRYRQPTSFMSSIDDFQSEMTALSAERPASGKAPSSGRPGSTSSANVPGVRPADSPGSPRPVNKSHRGKAPMGASSGRPSGLTAPAPSRARQGSTVKRTSPPSQVKRAGDVDGTSNS